MRDFRDIKAWHKAHQLALTVYKATRSFPIAEQYELVTQSRRAAASVPANIAEGCGRDGEGEAELARFCEIASGSASELEYHLLLERDLGFLSADEHKALDSDVNEVKRMLNAFTRSLRTSS